MSHKLNILSLNVKGLRNVNKRRAIFSYLKNKKATIFNLQETFSKQEDEKAWSAEWGGKILFSHGSEHSKGVSILVNPNSTFQLSTVEIDSHGRYIIAKLQIEETIFFLVNIFAPNEHREQEQFIRTLSEKQISKTDTSKIIITGDWNTTLNKIDKHGGLPWKGTTYRNSIIDLMEELDLLDIYRELFHANTRTFTYETKNLKIKSRIDFFLVSRTVSVNVKRVEIRCSVASDHKSIFLGIELKSGLKRGPGTWKFNNTLLDDKNYVDLILYVPLSPNTRKV